LRRDPLPLQKVIEPSDAYLVASISARSFLLGLSIGLLVATNFGRFRRNACKSVNQNGFIQHSINAACESEPLRAR